MVRLIALDVRYIPVFKSPKMAHEWPSYKKSKKFGLRGDRTRAWRAESQPGPGRAQAGPAGPNEPCMVGGDTQFVHFVWKSMNFKTIGSAGSPFYHICAARKKEERWRFIFIYYQKPRFQSAPGVLLATPSYLPISETKVLCVPWFLRFLSPSSIA